MNSLRSICLFLVLSACAFAQVKLASSAASNLPSAPVPQTHSQSTGAGATPMGPQATAPQPPVTPTELSLKDAQALALRNNPQVSIARLTALASIQVTREVRSNLWPTASIDLTAVDANPGTRLTAGALNNPTLYQRAAVGAAVSQLITDFGRTTNLVSSANLSAKAENQNAVATKEQIMRC
jgi:outer membrane protein